MARKTDGRTEQFKVKLTKKARRIIEARAKASVRTVEQELTFMIESALSKKAQTVDFRRYDDSAPAPVAESNPEPEMAPSHPAQSASAWTTAQEAEIYEIGKKAGMSEAQITATRLIHKTFEATVAAIQAEAVA